MEGNPMRETIREHTTTLNLFSAATTVKDTFTEHIGIHCTEHENPSLGYLETAHRAI